MGRKTDDGKGSDAGSDLAVPVSAAAREKSAGNGHVACSVAEGRNGSPVTAEDLALREDICYMIFGEVGGLIRDFSCAWDHKVLMHGRMYVTERRLCFYANFFGLEAKMSLRHEDVARCMKGNSAIFIPNTIVVQDKSGKDFVFRNFWERDECYSLLDKLRGGAQEQEEALAAEAAAAAEAASAKLDALQAEEEEALANGESITDDGSHHGDAFPSPERGTEQVISATAPQRTGSSSSSEGIVQRSRSLSPSPLAMDEYGPSSAPPPARTRSATAVPSSLPSSPYSARGTRSVLAARPSPALVAKDPGTPHQATTLGLAVLGAGHDVPSPRAVYGLSGSRRRQCHPQQQQQQQHRSPLRQAARVSGAGGGAIGGGWSSGEGASACPSDTMPAAGATPSALFERSPPATKAANGSASSSQVPRPGMSDSRGRDQGDGNEGSSSSSSSSSSRSSDGGAGGGPVKETEERERAASSDGRAQAEARQANGGRSSFRRRSSQLWRMMRWNSGGAGGEEDPEADRDAMEKAILAGGDHSAVAEARLDISVRDFYEAFFADDAAYGLPAFHMSRGDWEVDAGEWQQTDEDSKKTSGPGGGGEDGCRASREKEGKGVAAGEGGLTRAIRFKTPLHISFMSSPGQVRTLKRQRARFFGGAGCIVDTITTVEDRIPLSDNFHVEDRWIIRPSGNQGKGCKAAVSWRCVWHKFTVIKGLIEGKARSDVTSFNVAFLEGMRAHLEDSATRTLKRRPSLRESLLSAAPGPRGARERSMSGRGSEQSGLVLSSQDMVRSESETEGLAITKALRRQRRHRRDRYLPAIRVLSICFILYISVFWVRFQMREEEKMSWMTSGRRGSGSRPTEDLMLLYAEWGRSSLALLDVSREARRLSAEISQKLVLPPAGGTEGRGRGRLLGRDSSPTDAEQLEMLDLLRGIDQKVEGIYRQAEDAVKTLESSASQIRDASTRDPEEHRSAEACRRGDGPCEQRQCVLEA